MDLRLAWVAYLTILRKELRTYFDSPIAYITLVLFVVPYGLISSELGTAYPGEGGIYDWVKRAYGSRWGKGSLAREGGSAGATHNYRVISPDGTNRVLKTKEEGLPVQAGL